MQGAPPLPLPLLLQLLLPSVIAFSLFREQQSVAVEGRFVCGEKAMVNLSVTLWDRNSSESFLVSQDVAVMRDDQLAEMKTNETGHFSLKGSDKVFFFLNPYVYARHNCNAFEVVIIRSP